MTSAHAKRLPMVELGIATIGAVLVVLYVALFAFNSLQLEGKYTPDSVFYINAAECLASGQGFVRTSEDLYQLIDTSGTLPVRITQWAPLYPFAIAVLSPALEPRAGALLVAALSLVPLFLAVSIIALRAGGASAALMAVAALIAFAPLQLAARHAWSETLGLTFMFAACALLQYVPDGPRSRRFAALAGFAAGLAFATRYAMLPLPFVCAAWLLFFGPTRKLQCAAIVIGAWALVAVPIMTRNLILAGRIGSGAAGTGRNTIVGGMHDTWTAISASFPGMWIWFILLCAAIAALAAAWRKRQRNDSVRNTERLVLLLAAWALIYLAFVILAQSRVRIDTIDTRLLLPATTTFLVAVYTGLFASFRRQTWLWTALGSGLILVHMTLEWSTVQAIRNIGPLPPHDVARVVRNASDLTWIQNNVSQRDLLIMEDGLDIPLFLGPLHVAFFSRAHRPDRQLDYDETKRYLEDSNAFKRYDHVWLLLHSTGDEAQSPFESALHDQALDPYPDIQLVEVLDDAIILEWRDRSK